MCIANSFSLTLLENVLSTDHLKMTVSTTDHMCLSSVEDKLSKMSRRKWDQRGRIFALGRQCEHSFFYGGLGLYKDEKDQEREGRKVERGKLRAEAGH